MPTYELLPDFHRDYDQLTVEQQRAFRLAVKKFILDLRQGAVRGSLRVKPLQNNPGVFEMTWEGANGRATFDYGPAVIPGERHVHWRRVGGHEIFQNP
jgi:hypothetical protein